MEGQLTGERSSIDPVGVYVRHRRLPSGRVMIVMIVRLRAGDLSRKIGRSNDEMVGRFRCWSGKAISGTVVGSCCDNRPLQWPTAGVKGQLRPS